MLDIVLSICGLNPIIPPLCTLVRLKIIFQKSSVHLIFFPLDKYLLVTGPFLIKKPINAIFLSLAVYYVIIDSQTIVCALSAITVTDHSGKSTISLGSIWQGIKS